MSSRVLGLLLIALLLFAGTRGHCCHLLAKGASSSPGQFEGGQESRQLCSAPDGREAGKRSSYSWHLVPLGVYGGISEGSLTSFLLGTDSPEVDDSRHILLDAGSVFTGLLKLAQPGNSLSAESAEDRAYGFLQKRVKAVMISHSHLDHVAGLAHVSPDLGGISRQKLVYGTESTIEAIKTSIFNNLAWPNLSTEPRLAPWAGGPIGGSIVNGSESLAAILYRRVDSNTRDLPIPGTDMCLAGVATVTHTTPSTGFLVGTPSESPSSFIAYFGDVGPDGGVTMRGVVAQVNTLFEHRCQQLSKPGALRALLLECSYIDGRLDAALYGHLTPMLVAQLIRGISKSCEGQLDVSDTHLIITHTKPTWGNIDNSSYTPTAAKKAIEFRSRAMLPSQVIRSQLEQHLKATMGQEWVSSRLHVSGDGRVQQGSILAL